MAGLEDFMWVDKYRPKLLDDVIIPEHTKNGLKDYIIKGEIPNILLYSKSPGTGKTTVAHALCNELGISPLFVNASLNNSIDDIRTTIVQYATTVSVFGDNKKIIIMDELDRYTAQAQDALKGILETVSKNCRFIGTCNTISRLTVYLQSRLQTIDFAFSPKELKLIQARMFKRCQEILNLEGIPFKSEVLAKLVGKYVPDNRKLLNVLQQFSSQYGCIDEGALGVLNSCDTDILIKAMKDKKYGLVKDWVFNNADSLSDDFYMKLFKTMELVVIPQSVPQVVLTIGEYQKYHSVVPDITLHFLSMLTEMMSSVQFRVE